MEKIKVVEDLGRGVAILERFGEVVFDGEEFAHGENFVLKILDVEADPKTDLLLSVEVEILEKE